MEQTERKQVTVAELRAELADLPDDMQVVITAYESGYTAPTIRRIEVTYRGTDSELPYVFGEWNERLVYESAAATVVLALER